MMSGRATPNALVPYEGKKSLSCTLAFNGQEVRHIVIAGEPWFVAVDVCECLGLPVGKSGAYMHRLKLDSCEKRPVGRMEYPSLFEGLKGASLTAISESGLYMLILRAHPSRPEVKAFQDWVTREVLPSIRKTGGYLLNEGARETAAVSPSMPTSFADALRRYADEVDKREQAERLAIELQAARELDAPKVVSCAYISTIRMAVASPAGAGAIPETAFPDLRYPMEPCRTERTGCP